jgi:hypothetical protein
MFPIRRYPRYNALALLLANIIDCFRDVLTKKYSMRHLPSQLRDCFHQYPLSLAKFKRFEEFVRLNDVRIK